MAQIRILSAQDVAQVFTVTDALQAVEDAYRQKALGQGRAWPMVYEQFEPGVADMDIRSGELAGSGLFGLKLTAWFSRNPERGLPEIFGTNLICDNATGEPLALLNASNITGLRTGAAAALGVKYLARKDAANLLLVGAGHMSAFAIAATLAACPRIEHVQVYNPRGGSGVGERVAAIAERVADILAAAGVECSYDISVADDSAEACAWADAIITATPSSEPVLEDAWVKPGTHISALGADMPGKQETPSALQARAALFVDDRAQSVASGELEVAICEGAISPDDIAAELGEVVAGQHPGRADDEQVTLFDTSGIAVQDLASCKAAYERAVELGLGTVVAL